MFKFAAKANVEERRRSERHAMRGSGKILTTAGSFPRDCWITDISDIHHLKAVGWFIPPVRSDSARMTGHADDVFEMPDGIIFGSSSDAQAGGLWAMRYKKGFYGKAKWNAAENGVEIEQVPRNDGGPA